MVKKLHVIFTSSNCGKRQQEEVAGGGGGGGGGYWLYVHGPLSSYSSST